MSGIWVQILQFILGLSLLIMLHELGHFFFARLFKTRVEKLYLFFDFLFPFSNILPFSLLKKKKGDTTYGIGWFPLGGYIKIAGMVDESMDKEQLAKPPEPWEFRSKKPWQRLLIMLGGIIVNVLVAFLIYSMVLFVWGEKKLPLSEMKHGVTVVDSLAYDLGFRNGDKIVSADGRKLSYYDQVMPELLYARSIVVERDGREETLDLPVNFVEQLIDNKGRQLFSVPFPAIVGNVLEGTGAEQAGLQPGDKIVSVSGAATPVFRDLRAALATHSGQEVALGLERDGQLLSVPAQVSDSGSLGFAPALPKNIEDGEKLGMYNLEVRKYGFFEAFPAGVSLAIDRLNFYVQQFKLILNPSTGAYKGVGGFVSITKIFPMEWDWQHFWNVTAFLSIILAFMNLLPIPGLDGGYVMFTLFEMITGRKVGDKVMEVATTIGLVLLLALMLYANGMDIFRIFQK